jgi:hypothetical protein
MSSSHFDPKRPFAAKHYWDKSLIGVKNKYFPEIFFRFEQTISPYSGQKAETGELAGESADALKRPMVYENGEP